MYQETKTHPLQEKVNYFKLCKALYSEIKKRDQMLEEYAFITSHELRAPIARIKGLINVFHTAKENENLCHALAGRLKNCAHELDEIAHTLNELTAAQSLDINE